MSKKVSFSDFLNSIERNDIDDYILHENTFTGVTKKMYFTHKVCGHEFYMVAKNFRSGQSCPKCAAEKRIAGNIKYFSDKEIDLINGKGLKLKEFNGYSKKNLFTHSCGNDILLTLNEVKNFKYCKYCTVKKVDKINKNINKYQEKLNDYDIEIIPEYFTSTVKLSKFKCKKCKEIFLGYYFNIQRGEAHCPNCFPKNMKDFEYYNLKLKELKLDDEYELIKNTFTNSINKMSIFHKTCNRIFEKSPSDFFSNEQHCPYCIDHRMYSDDEVSKILDECGFTKLDKYINSHTPIKIECKSCGRIIEKTLNNIKNNHSKCDCQNSVSSGELRIFKYLQSLGLTFETEKTFNDLIYINNLRFDFYIESANLCIEFDGIQHFKAIDFFGGEKAFQDLLVRDNLKNDYCNRNNIKLLRIPYWEIENIESIIDENI